MSIRNKGISVVLGTYNRKRFLKATINSIRNEIRHCEWPCEIIVIDGGSTDGTLKWLLRQKDIVTIVQHNHGTWEGVKVKRRSWGYFMNLGFRAASGQYVCMLSDDCLIVPGAISNACTLLHDEIAAGKNVGAAAFYWRNWPEDRKYRIGTTLAKKVFVNHGIYLKKALEDVGYADENTYFFYHADGDLCLKMWEKGYVCIDSNQSFIEHYSHANMKARQSNMERQREDWENYLNKWGGIYYFPSDESTGGCIEIEYTDKTDVANMFKKARRYSWLTRRT